MDKASRKALQAQYRQTRPEAGVYRIVNGRTGRALLGSSSNLPSVQAKLDFARRTNTPSALDHRLHADARQYGPDAFTFEILERLDLTPEASNQQLQSDLATLEALWRERLQSADVY